VPGNLIAQLIVELPQRRLVNLIRRQQGQPLRRQGVCKPRPLRIRRNQELDLASVGLKPVPRPHLERRRVGAVDPGVHVLIEVGDHRVDQRPVVVLVPSVDRYEPAPIGSADGVGRGSRRSVAHQVPRSGPRGSNDNLIQVIAMDLCFGNHSFDHDSRSGGLVTVPRAVGLKCFSCAQFGRHD